MTSFGVDEQALYINYDTVSQAYPGWTFTEIRHMSGRQRNYWLRMCRWKRDRERNV